VSAREFASNIIRQSVRWLDAARMWLLRNDIKRWQQNIRETPVWDERNRILASLIPPGSSVIDLGAGAQTLRHHLVNCEYQPCDLVPHGDALYCDFNKNIFPATTKKYDFIVCSGVLEYIRNPHRFLSQIFKLGSQGFLTYAPLLPGQKRLTRLRGGWVNHFREDQLEMLFARSGVRFVKVQEWNGQLIYRIEPSQASATPASCAS
jgi:hypothetical protein